MSTGCTSPRQMPVPNPIGHIAGQQGRLLFGQLVSQQRAATLKWWSRQVRKRSGRHFGLQARVWVQVRFEDFGADRQTRSRSQRDTLFEHRFEGSVGARSFDVHLRFDFSTFVVFETPSTRPLGDTKASMP